MWSTPTDWSQFETTASSNTGVVQFVGQEALKERVSPFLEADEFPHTLLTGEPGLGKSQFAEWIAVTRNVDYQVLTAPVAEADLDVAVWKPFVILDEAHKQKDSTWLFQLMNQHEYTFIATTNLPERMDDAFRSRFVMQLRDCTVHTRGHDENCVVLFVWWMRGRSTSSRIRCCVRR